MNIENIKEEDLGEIIEEDQGAIIEEIMKKIILKQISIIKRLLIMTVIGILILKRIIIFHFQN